MGILYPWVRGSCPTHDTHGSKSGYGFRLSKDSCLVAQKTKWNTKLRLPMLIIDFHGSTLKDQSTSKRSQIARRVISSRAEGYSAFRNYL